MLQPFIDRDQGVFSFVYRLKLAVQKKDEPLLNPILFFPLNEFAVSTFCFHFFYPSRCSISYLSQVDMFQSFLVVACKVVV